MFDGYQETEKPRSDNLFWVSRRGARIALIVVHVVAVLAVFVELVQPFSEGAEAVKRASSLDFPASYAVYGFTACVLLVLLGRFLRRVVMRDEDYYRGDT